MCLLVAAAAEPPRSSDLATLANALLRSDAFALAFVRDDMVVFANAGFLRLFRQANEQMEMPLAALFIPEHRGRIASLLADSSRTSADCIAEAIESGSTFAQVELRAAPLDADDATLRAVIAQDVTDRARATARLNLLAFSDPLTGLANRAMFSDRLRQAVLEARRDGIGFAVIMLDLDDFKPVNDRYGHAAGDVVLQHIATRLQVALRPTETIARLGGDEFAVLLRGIRRSADAAVVADRLLTTIRQPILVSGQVATVCASAGLALFPDHGRAVEHVLIAADTALYVAKRAGGDRPVWAGDHAVAATPEPAAVAWRAAYEVGVPEMDADHRHLTDLLGGLAAALLNGLDPTPPFRAFISASARHFANEERLMAEACYAGAAAHRELHQRLLADIAGLVLDGEGVSASVVLRYLQEWLFRHIDGPDRTFAKRKSPPHPTTVGG